MNHFTDKIPEMVVDYVKSITEHKKLNIKVVRPRKTKHGDFRKKNSNYMITINNINNKYKFLMILIHEIAHFNVLKKNIKEKPHGHHWKNEFKKLAKPILNNKVFPVDLLKLLKTHMSNPKSSFSYDSDLVKELNKYDSNTHYTYLDEIKDGLKFKYENNKIYQKIKKRRKRYLCIDMEDRRKYLFLPHAKVQLL